MNTTDRDLLAVVRNWHRESLKALSDPRRKPRPAVVTNADNTATNIKSASTVR